jgi:NitT/TauT family transport system substrate-binding protein
LPEVFLKNHKVKADIIPIKSTVNLFLLDGLDAMCVMWYNEYHQIINSGINENELNSFFFKDYDMDIPEDGIYCSEEFYSENKDVCKRFVEATIFGWEYAFRNTEETLDVVQKYMQRYNIPSNRSHQEWMLNRMKDLFTYDSTDEVTVILDHVKFEECIDLLLRNNFIDKYPAYDSFFVGNYGE